MNSDNDFYEQSDEPRFDVEIEGKISSEEKKAREVFIHIDVY